ncbi:tyrosine-type recombinase/integrase [Nocardioides sp.]|uniref:tyrosine-type recombinase/integrase n=1 Tax=Nocardioides sp. TaxID=35761 RepID=UPI0035631C77
MASTKRSDGEGSIYQRHLPECPKPINGTRPKHTCKGPWIAVLVTGWREGKPIRKKVSATSKAGAAAKLRQLREKVESGQLPSGRTPTVQEWMTYWLNEIAAKKVRPSTLRGYRTYVDCYINPLLGSKRLDRLTPEHIASAWQELQDVGRPGVANPKPLSSTSAHQAHRILSRGLKVAYQRGHVTRNVATMIDAPQPADIEMQPLTKEDAFAVLSAARGRRNAARWTVALALGLRQGEALGLRWENVDLEAGTLAVRQALGRVKGQGLVLGPVKSRAGRRTVAIPAQLLTELRAHRITQNEERLAAGSWWVDGDYVFARVDGRPIDPKADWVEWKALLTDAGVREARLHDARHTAATMLLAMGVPLRTTMEILGHSRITVTSRYQHVVDEMHRDAAEKMDAFWA